MILFSPVVIYEWPMIILCLPRNFIQIYYTNELEFSNVNTSI